MSAAVDSLTGGAQSSAQGHKRFNMALIEQRQHSQVIFNEDITQMDTLVVSAPSTPFSARRASSGAASQRSTRPALPPRWNTRGMSMATHAAINTTLSSRTWNQRVQTHNGDDIR